MLDLSKFNVPPGAKWVAADANGTVYAYEDAPHRIDLAELWTAGQGFCRRIGKVRPSIVDWRESLTPVNTTDTLLAALLSLDGVQECDLIAAFVRADPRRADAFCVTLAEALEPAQSAALPTCKMCGAILEWEVCFYHCDDGYFSTEVCDICHGAGGLWVCPAGKHSPDADEYGEHYTGGDTLIFL